VNPVNPVIDPKGREGVSLSYGVSPWKRHNTRSVGIGAVTGFTRFTSSCPIVVRRGRTVVPR
jgi:hypothetical protein